MSKVAQMSATTESTEEMERFQLFYSMEKNDGYSMQTTKQVRQITPQAESDGWNCKALLQRI